MSSSAQIGMVGCVNAIERLRDGSKEEQLRVRVAELEAALRELCRWKRSDGDCWCDSPWAHSPGCLAARAAMEKR